MRKNIVGLCYQGLQHNGQFKEFKGRGEQDMKTCICQEPCEGGKASSPQVEPKGPS